MADEERTREEAGYDEDVAEEQPEDRQVTAQQDEYERFADEVDRRRGRGRLRGARARARQPAQGLLDPGRRPERGQPLPLAHGREARPRRRGRDRDHRRRQAVRPHADPQRPQPRPSRRPDLDGARPVGHRQVRADQAHRRPALSGLRRPARARRVGPEHDRRRALRDAQEVRPAVPGRGAVRLDEHLRQRRLPAAPAHRQVRGRDRRDRQPAPARGRPLRGAREDAERALGRDAQARRASPGRWCSTRRSSCSTSPTRASTRCARRCSAS